MMIVWRIRGKIIRTVPRCVEQFLQVSVVLGFVSSCICLGLAFCVFFSFSLDYFVLVLFAFDVLGLVSSVLCQEIGWEEHLQGDLFCVEWDVKP